MRLANLAVAARMRLLTGLMLLGLIALCAVRLNSLRNGMMDDRKVQTKHIVESGLGVLQHFQSLAQRGEMSEEDAKKAARETLRAVRYDKSNYLFIVTRDSHYILHPVKPAMEGQDASTLKDTNGKLIIQDIVKAAAAGGGLVEYTFPKPGNPESFPKVSYAALLPEWGWIIGTGIYVDDVDSEFRQIAWTLGAISVALLVALGVFGWRISASVTRQLGGEPGNATAVMRAAAEGNLTADTGRSPAGSMLHALGAMMRALRRMVGEINDGANQLVGNADHIARVSAEVAEAAGRQSDATSAMAASMEELTASSSHISTSARETERNAHESMRLANDGSRRVDEAVAAIRKMADTVIGASDRIRALEGRIGEVSSIANVIKEIAGQTNLLALNAAIEAARAGEQGRGFAVVADEVRKLAERTSSATTEIEQMITGIQGDTGNAVSAMNAALPEVDHGIQLAAAASEALIAIEKGAREALERVHEIADATHEQSTASTAITRQVEEISQMVENTSANIRGAADAAINLERIAGRLKEQVALFRV